MTMSCTQALFSLLPRRARRQLPGGDEPHSAHTAPSHFTIRAFRPVDPSSSVYQSQVQQLRYQEQHPFSISPDFDEMAEDAHRHKRARHEDSKPKTEQCRICFNDIEDPYLTPCLVCRKPYCNECLTKQFEMALKDKEMMPTRCCRKVVYHNVARSILSPAQLEIYKQRYDESMTPNPFYCPKPTCSAFIPPRLLKPVRGKVTCNLCHTISCLKCRQTADPLRHECSGASQEDVIIKEFGYKRCPKCNTAAMKMYGCPHVRCNNCAAHFCWDCLRPINICNVKPCAAARYQGDQSEPDEGDSFTDDDDTATIRTADNGDDSIGFNARVTASQPDLNRPAPTSPTVRAARSDSMLLLANVAEIQRLAPLIPRPDTPVPTGAQEPPAHPVQGPQTGTAQPANNSNLDDPHRIDVDWEDLNAYDFGEEPEDADWDIWGCLHRFNVLKSETIPDRWFIGLDKSKVVDVECMGCFRAMQIEPAPKEEQEGDKRKGNETLPLVTNIGSVLKPITIVDSDQAEPATVGEFTKPAKEDKKKAVYDCSDCGVIFCWWCRRTALRRMEKYRQDTGQTEGVVSV